MQSSSTSTNTLLLTLLHATRFQVSLMNFVFLVFWTFGPTHPHDQHLGSHGGMYFHFISLFHVVFLNTWINW